MLIRYLLKSLLARAANNAVAVISIGITVGACVLSLAFYHGLRKNMASSGREDNLMVLSGGVLAPTKSMLSKEMVEKLRILPEVVQEGGQALVSPEVHVELSLGENAQPVPMRGIEQIAFRVHDQVTIIEGRAPEAGAAELLLGYKLLNRTPEAKVGGTLMVRGSRWAIVGVFSAGGTALENEVWGDRSRLLADMKQAASVLSAVIRLQSTSAVEPTIEKLKTIRTSIAGDRAWGLSERKHYEVTIGNVELVKQAVTGIIVILLLGATFAAANTLHASMMGKVRDFATLWLLGFRRGQLVTLVFQESLVIVGAAAALAVLLSAAAAGVQVTELLGGQVEFGLPFGLRQLADAAALAGVIGLLSAMYPAVVVMRGDLFKSIS